MKLLDIEIEKFLTIDSAKVGLNDRGLVLVQGENLADSSADSNGAGKSTFAEALFWCLFGETSRGIGGDDVINWAAKKGTRVATRIEDGDTVYEIARHRKHKTGKNALRILMTDVAGDVYDLTKGTDKLTQVLVSEILGASREVFVAAVLAGQNQMPDLPGMTDKNLKVIVEEAAGTTVLEKGHKVALTQLGEAKATATSAGISVDSLNTRLESVKGDIEHIDGQILVWENARKGEVSRRADVVKAIVAEVKQDRVEQSKTDRDALQQELDEGEARIAGLSGEVVEERRLLGLVREADNVVAIWNSSIASLTTKAQRERKVHEGMDHQIGCPCSTCDKPFTADDIAPAKIRAAATLRETLIELRDQKAALATHQEALTNAHTALAAHRASMTDASATNALCGERRASLAAYDRETTRIQARAAEARAENERIKAIQLQPNPHEPSKKRYQDTAEQLVKAIADAVAKLEEANVELEIAEEVAKVFSPAGARAEMLDEVTPYLNAQTAKYLGTLSDGNIRAQWSTLTKNKAGELKEKFAIEVENDLGGTKFAAISGGEQRKVRVAAALALQDLVASRATKPIPLFVGDEIDDALDPAGVERLTMILQEKARERGTVFVISHSDLKDWVPQVMKVTKTGRGQSTIEEIFA